MKRGEKSNDVSSLVSNLEGNGEHFMTSGPWFEFAPRSEQEVVTLFGLLLPNLPYRLLINEVREAFPDCLAWKLDENGERKLVRIEFELRASNFLAHRHDPDGCDLIVCWEDDMGNFKVPRLELSALVSKLNTGIIESPDRVKYPAQVWTVESFLKAAPPELQESHLEFLDWARGLARQCRVAFGEGNQFPSWSLAVSLKTGKKITLLGVYADGTLWVQPQGLPKRLGELYRSHLMKAVQGSDLGKQWFLRQKGIADLNFISTLKEAVESTLKAAVE